MSPAPPDVQSLIEPTAHEPGERAEQLSPAHGRIGARSPGIGQAILVHVRPERHDFRAWARLARPPLDELRDPRHDHGGIPGQPLKIEQHEVEWAGGRLALEAPPRVYAGRQRPRQRRDPARGEQVGRHEQDLQFTLHPPAPARWSRNTGGSIARCTEADHRAGHE